MFCHFLGDFSKGFLVFVRLFLLFGLRNGPFGDCLDDFSRVLEGKSQWLDGNSLQPGLYKGMPIKHMFDRNGS